MITIDNILFCHDFSDTADFALPYAIVMAEKFSASLHVIHVIEEIFHNWAYVETTVDLAMLDKISDDMGKRAKQAFDDISDSKAAGLKGYHPIVSKGIPFLKILDIAKKKEIDLIIMGTHGRTGLSHVLFGSVAERVLRDAPCPVLTVRMPA